MCVLYSIVAICSVTRVTWHRLLVCIPVVFGRFIPTCQSLDCFQSADPSPKRISSVGSESALLFCFKQQEKVSFSFKTFLTVFLSKNLFPKLYPNWQHLPSGSKFMFTVIPVPDQQHCFKKTAFCYFGFLFSFKVNFSCAFLAHRLDDVWLRSGQGWEFALLLFTKRVTRANWADHSFEHKRDSLFLRVGFAPFWRENWTWTFLSHFLALLL